MRNKFTRRTPEQSAWQWLWSTGGHSGLSPEEERARNFQNRANEVRRSFANRGNDMRTAHQDLRNTAAIGQALMKNDILSFTNMLRRSTKKK